MIIKADPAIFPNDVRQLLQGLSQEMFFEKGILCGSWVMVVYRCFHRLAYTLRTEDIDFDVEAVRNCVSGLSVTGASAAFGGMSPLGAGVVEQAS